jgi:Ca2+-binding EF-hand superfamily protein
MSTQFEKTVIENLNKFRENPQSIIHSIEVYRKGLSRIKSKDPLLQEIDKYLLVLQKMKPVPPLTLNSELSKIAQNEAKKFCLNNKDYKCYQVGNELKNVIPDYYLSENPALLADIGSDDPNNQIVKLLLNKVDTKKKGRSFITDPFYTQVGIGLQIFEEENYIILIFANSEKNYVPKVERKIISIDEMNELKQAFDLFDFEKNQTIKINDAIEALKYMNYDTINPELYKILNELSEENEIVSWENFSNHVNSRLNDYNTENGLRTIFNLCIDNPKEETITFETFKRICSEIGENMSDTQMKHILKNATLKGDQITFEEFCEYIKA